MPRPVCITRPQYEQLRRAAAGKEKQVVVSFPLRLSSITLEMKRIVDSGVLGRLTMVQAVNNVPYGSVYYHSWYRDPAETGGLFLQKATHDIDYIHFLTGERPVSVCAKTAKLHFKGDRPAGLHCPDCPDYRTCPESSYVVKNILKEDVQGDQSPTNSTFPQACISAETRCWHWIFCACWTAEKHAPTFQPGL